MEDQILKHLYRQKIAPSNVQARYGQILAAGFFLSPMSLDSGRRTTPILQSSESGWSPCLVLLI